MQQELVTRELTINAPAAEVWKALTMPERIKVWFFDTGAPAIQPGVTFTITVEHDAKNYAVTCRILTIEKEKRLAFTWSYDEFPADTIVTFELIAPGSQKTILKFSHMGIEDIPAANNMLSTASHHESWKQILESGLKSYAEKTWAVWKKLE